VLHIVIGDARAYMAAGRQALVEVKDRRGRPLDARDLRKVKFRQFISHPPSRPHSYINSTTKPLNL
jgi:hypothetical protein